MFAIERETSDRLVAVAMAGVRVRLNGGLSRLLGGDTGAPPSTSGQPGKKATAMLHAACRQTQWEFRGRRSDLPYAIFHFNLSRITLHRFSVLLDYQTDCHSCDVNAG